MNFAEQPPSTAWAGLKYRGQTVAEVWFKPEGEPFALRFRVPGESFRLPVVGPQLTAERLLRAVGVSAAEVESWQCEGAGASDAGLGDPLPPPALERLELSVRVKPPAPVDASEPGGATSAREANWDYFEGRWNAILGVEASIDALRMNLDGLRGEMEAAARRPLNLEEKVNALSSDVVLWNKAKSRLRYALPKLREFVHRSTWANGIPERKAVEELFARHVQPRIPFPEPEQVVAQFDALLKNRQVLSAQGVSVCQECQSVLAEVNGTLRNLQRNAAANAAKKRGSMGARGKTR